MEPHLSRYYNSNALWGRISGLSSVKDVPQTGNEVRVIWEPKELLCLQLGQAEICSGSDQDKTGAGLTWRLATGVVNNGFFRWSGYGTAPSRDVRYSREPTLHTEVEAQSG